MKMVLLLSLIFSSSTYAATPAEMIQKLNDRYEDFFARRRANEKRDQGRQKGAGQIQQTRQMHQELMERARKKQALERKPPPDMTASYKRHLQQEELKKKEQLKQEANYSKSKAEVERIMKKGKKIPEVLEYELQDAL